MAYNRLKLFWGAVDISHADESPYAPAQIKAMGENAIPPGIGVRRCQIVISRAPSGSVEDVATCSIDFLNLTGGNPDDTWVDADFVSCEGRLDTFWSGMAAYMHTSATVSSYRWYRIGPGVSPPNPPVRITSKSFVGSGSNMMPPQMAISITEKTAVRREWGRFYIPQVNATANNGTNGRIATSTVNSIATLAGALYSGSSSGDFPIVVYSRVRGKAYTVESVQVDDLWDVQRRRRYDRPLLRSVP